MQVCVCDISELSQICNVNGDISVPFKDVAQCIAWSNLYTYLPCRSLMLPWKFRLASSILTAEQLALASAYHNFK